jgi:hypothetical protein
MHVRSKERSRGEMLSRAAQHNNPRPQASQIKSIDFMQGFVGAFIGPTSGKRELNSEEVLFPCVIRLSLTVYDTR